MSQSQVPKGAWVLQILPEERGEPEARGPMLWSKRGRGGWSGHWLWLGLKGTTEPVKKNYTKTPAGAHQPYRGDHR